MFRGDRQWKSITGKDHTQHPKMCFIHVGKCGGGTMVDLLREKCACSYRLFKHARPFQQPAAHEQDFMQFHVSQIKKGSRMAKECFQDRLVILWVCDPVQRFISSFRWTVDVNAAKLTRYVKTEHLDPTRYSDLDFLVSTIVADGRNASKFVSRVSHGEQSLSWYFDGDFSIFDDMPNLFVGRMEYFQTDYDMLLRVMNYNDTNFKAQTARSHRSTKGNINVSEGTIDFLRKLEQTKADYDCLQRLVDKCLISQDYVNQMRQRLSYAML